MQETCNVDIPKTWKNLIEFTVMRFSSVRVDILHSLIMALFDLVYRLVIFSYRSAISL